MFLLARRIPPDFVFSSLLLQKCGYEQLSVKHGILNVCLSRRDVSVVLLAKLRNVNSTALLGIKSHFKCGSYVTVSLFCLARSQYKRISWVERCWLSRCFCEYCDTTEQSYKEEMSSVALLKNVITISKKISKVFVKNSQITLTIAFN